MMTRFSSAAMLLLLMVPQALFSQESPREVDQSLERVRPIRVVLGSNGAPVKLIEKPLLRFGEPARSNEEGSLWAWGQSGRPVLISEIYHNTGDQESWVHVMSLTSNKLVTAQTQAGRWHPEQLQLDLKPVEGVGTPSDRSRARLLQMRKIVRRYAAHQFWDPNNSRFELRLLPSPLHRYQDAEEGVLDGAVFTFAHGTNPEILVLIEAHTIDDTRVWKAGFASLGSAEMHVTLEGADVWKLSRATDVTGRPTDPYWLFSTSPAEEP